MRRQPTAMPGHHIDGIRASAEVMDEQDGGLAACLAIGEQQRPQSAQDVIPRRHVVADGRGWTHTRAVAMPHAHERIYRHVIARGGDCPARANVEATGATDLAAPRMGTKRGVDPDVSWLFELADHLGCIE